MLQRRISMLVAGTVMAALSSPWAGE